MDHNEFIIYHNISFYKKLLLLMIWKILMYKVLLSQQIFGRFEG